MNRFQFVADHSTTSGAGPRRGWSVKRLCELVEIERSTYYAWLKAAPARRERSEADAALAERSGPSTTPTSSGCSPDHRRAQLRC